VLIPTIASAQATITGTVKDTSGAVLPGVTVEASSPVLIEKVRTVVTDGSGQYRIVTLPPGTYVVKFSLGGFTTVQRDDLIVSGSGVVPVNADMRVGALSETIVVAGSSPLVDTQTTRRETVMGSSSNPARREEPTPVRQTESRPSFGSLGSVTPKEEPAPAPEPVADLPSSPPVPPSRTYSDSAAEELDVPDFLK